MDTSSFLRQIKTQAGYNGQVVHIEHIPARTAVHGELEQSLAAPLQESLAKRGLLPLYLHQAEAVNSARRGNNVMVATASASGKTLCYNIPVIQAMLTEPDTRFLYLFPTKALAQDQLRSLGELCCPELCSGDEFATFDGDTPSKERADIRKQARIVLSNPDMLHLGILPNHRQWSRMLRHLRYVVIDEAHVYRGVFGSHLTGVLRRLRRLCRIYGSEPQFICSSATIANPGEHAEQLTGLPFVVVDSDGAPRSEKDFVFWNPPLIDAAKSTRRSANTEATNLFTALVSKGIRTLTFTRTRRLTELIYTYSRDRLATADPLLAGRIKPYRAGYLPKERRKIEQQLFSGKLLGVVATSALELGINIGDLEATVLTGYPGSIASTWQQAGRSGRSKEQSSSFLIGLDGPLDQYLMRHPEFFFNSSFENALVNPDNPYIARAHLLCAAWEMPLSKDDEEFFGETLEREGAELEKRGVLRKRRGRQYVSPAIAHPAQSISIRSTSGENYSIWDSGTNTLLETIEDSVAFFQIHPGAVYLHQGEAFLINALDIASRTAYADRIEANYYTQCKDLTDLHILRKRREKRTRRAWVHLGEVEVTTTVVGYRRKAQFTDEVLGEEPLELPPQNFPTVALWFDLPDEAIAEVEREKLGTCRNWYSATLCPV